MLVLSRKVGERIRIGGGIVVTVIDARGEKVKLGIAAPPEVEVHREEVYQRLQISPADDSQALARRASASPNVAGAANPACRRTD